MLCVFFWLNLCVSLFCLLQGKRQLQQIDEGKENDTFWGALGGKGPYPDSKELGNPMHEPRLFHCTTAKGASFQVRCPACCVLSVRMLYCISYRDVKLNAGWWSLQLRSIRLDPRWCAVFGLLHWSVCVGRWRSLTGRKNKSAQTCSGICPYVSLLSVPFYVLCIFCWARRRVDFVCVWVCITFLSAYVNGFARAYTLFRRMCRQHLINAHLTLLCFVLPRAQSLLPSPVTSLVGMTEWPR